MTSTRLFEEEWDGLAIAEETRALYDVDMTPPPVARMCLKELQAIVERHDLPEDERPAPPRTIVDLGAGSGCWSMVARELWPNAEIIAVEIRAEEAVNLAAWCDKIVIGDIREGGPTTIGEVTPYTSATLEKLPPSIDLAIGNIPFSLVDTTMKLKPDGTPHKCRGLAFEAFVLGMRHRLSTDDGRVALFVPASWWQRGEKPARLAQDNPPCEQMNVPLGIKFRLKGSGDSLCYTQFTWSRRSRGRRWATWDMALLDSSDRQWKTVPGRVRR